MGRGNDEVASFLEEAASLARGIRGGGGYRAYLNRIGTKLLEVGCSVVLFEMLNYLTTTQRICCCEAREGCLILKSILRHAISEVEICVHSHTTRTSGEDKRGWHCNVFLSDLDLNNALWNIIGVIRNRMQPGYRAVTRRRRKYSGNRLGDRPTPLKKKMQSTSEKTSLC